jgi:hypothetical protein
MAQDGGFALHVMKQLNPRSAWVFAKHSRVIAEGATPPKIRPQVSRTRQFVRLKETFGHDYGAGRRPCASRDWVRNTDIQNKMKAEIEDYLFDEVEAKHNVKIDTTMLDEILDRLIELARFRDAL